jgi:hypothetical protein
MTTTLTSDFYGRCLLHGTGIAEILNFTLNMVGGTSGGPIDNTTDTKSFHGDQEIVAEKYQLCARQQEPNFGLGSFQWVNFTSCMNGYKGIAICTMYLPNQINAVAKTCAEATGFEWSTLDACATGAEGATLFKASEYYTWGEMQAKRIPKYGTAGGADWGIPIIRINGVVHKDTPDAYDLLGERICKAAGKIRNCGCAAAPPS